MINSNIQLFSFISSIMIGFIYCYLYKYYFKIFKKQKIIFLIFIDALFIIINLVSLIFLYMRINGGYIHYSFIIFWIIGYLVAIKVNKYVKRH